MLIAIPKETREGETRVAATPDIIKKYIQSQGAKNDEQIN